MPQQSNEPPQWLKGKARICSPIPEVLDRNLAIYCVKTGTTKQEVLIKALRQYLQQQGMDPDKMPKVEVSY